MMFLFSSVLVTRVSSLVCTQGAGSQAIKVLNRAHHTKRESGRMLHCSFCFPFSISHCDCEVESVIEKLNLKKCADTVVGSPGLVRGISGGERKRTNVALSLLGSPSLLLLDEPTSGLDSKMSDSLMRDVKQITEQGCTVVATIHQPSEAVFMRFDKVLLLETGRATWLGLNSFRSRDWSTLLNLFLRRISHERVA